MSNESGFDEILPTTTSDEDAVGWGDAPVTDDSQDADDERLRREVPPHHGG
ncbi:MAG: hypothetical protein WAN48_08075 [Actinomycetes bacterium]